MKDRAKSGEYHSALAFIDRRNILNISITIDMRTIVRSDYHG